MRQRRRRPVNWFAVTVIVILIAFFSYLNTVVIPSMPQPFVPSPTPTRDPESYVSEAEALFGQGKLLQAIAVYEEVLRLTPDNAGLYVSLARIQLFAGQPAEALQSAERALLLERDNSMAHALRGAALTQQGDYLMAESALQRALELEPNNGIAHALYAELLGNMYLNNSGPFNALDLAIEESRLGVQLAPSSIEAHRARGFILELTGNYEVAIQEYQQAIAINSNIPELHLALGRTYRVTGVLDRAVEEYTLANTLNPSDPRPDLYTSRVYFYTGDYGKAAQYAEQAVKDDPTDAYLRGNWGVILYHNLQWPNAVTQLSLAVNGGATEDGQAIVPLVLDGSDGRVTEYFFTYALVLARLNQCNEALPVAQLILTAVPTDDIAVYNAQFAIGLCEQSLQSSSGGQPSSPSETSP